MILKKIGIESKKKFDNNFDELYDKYKNKSIELGLSHKELKFIKEHSKILIYLIIEND